jgi:hypothetical protein
MVAPSPLSVAPHSQTGSPNKIIALQVLCIQAEFKSGVVHLTQIGNHTAKTGDVGQGAVNQQITRVADIIINSTTSKV